MSGKERVAIPAFDRQTIRLNNDLLMSGMRMGTMQMLENKQRINLTILFSLEEKVWLEYHTFF